MGGHKVGLIGVNRSRVVAEPERLTQCKGFIDLGAEHLGCLGDLGAQPRSCTFSTTAGLDDGSPVLSLEFNNGFSYFTPKTVELHITKVGGVAPDLKSYSAAIATCEAKGQWQRAFRLLSRMHDVSVAPDVGCYHGVMGACKTGNKWESAVE